MAITRRDFLKSSAAAAAALTVPHPIFRGMAHAAGPAGAIVVHPADGRRQRRA